VSALVRMAPSLSVLSPADAEAFLEHGYVLVREAIARETIEQLLPQIWARLPEDPTDPRTWRRGGTQIEDILREGPIDDLFTPRFTQSIDDLAGAGRWWTRRDGFGWVVLRFPGHAAPWRPPSSGWHVDGIDFHHHLRSPEQGLVGIELFSDIEPGGGGTVLRVGSHRVIARLLGASEPDGLSYARLRGLSEELRELPAVETTGRAGDVLWMHPFMVHARGPNVRSTVRVASNRCVGLHEPMCLERAQESDHSLVERAIRRALAEG
jgi:hypothetical protein